MAYNKFNLADFAKLLADGKLIIDIGAGSSNPFIEYETSSDTIIVNLGNTSKILFTSGTGSTKIAKIASDGTVTLAGAIDPNKTVT